jgi:hypothetical protein
LAGGGAGTRVSNIFEQCRHVMNVCTSASGTRYALPQLGQ